MKSQCHRHTIVIAYQPNRSESRVQSGYKGCSPYIYIYIAEEQDRSVDILAQALSTQKRGAIVESSDKRSWDSASPNISHIVQGWQLLATVGGSIQN